MQVPLISLFGASNELPQEAELEALFDRFLLRLTVDYVSESGFTRLQHLLANHQATVLPQTISQVELTALQQAAATIQLPASVMDAIAQLRRDLMTKGIRLSDRRWGKTHGVLRAHALLEGRAVIEEDDLLILRHVLWTAPDQQSEVSRLCARIGNPINGKATELTDQAASVFDTTMTAHQLGRDTQEKVSVVAEGIDKFKSIHTTLAQLQEQAFAQGRPTDKIEKAINSVLTMREKVGALILGAM
jgi:MoxR-like ATPase